MQTLLQSYSVTEIFAFLVIAAVALKGVINFFDWAVDRLRKIFDKEYKTQSEKDKLEYRLKSGSEKMNQLTSEQAVIKNDVNDMKKDIEILKKSDKNDIKAYLTDRHHYFCYEKGWIDYYSLECCEARYKDYKEEGGNTFVDDLMKEIRALSKQPTGQTPTKPVKQQSSKQQSHN